MRILVSLGRPRTAWLVLTLTALLAVSGPAAPAGAAAGAARRRGYRQEQAPEMDSRSNLLRHRGLGRPHSRVHLRDRHGPASGQRQRRGLRWKLVERCNRLGGTDEIWQARAARQFFGNITARLGQRATGSIMVASFMGAGRLTSAKAARTRGRPLVRIAAKAHSWIQAIGQDTSAATSSPRMVRRCGSMTTLPDGATGFRSQHPTSGTPERRSSTPRQPMPAGNRGGRHRSRQLDSLLA
jgi:hypothetical protein